MSTLALTLAFPPVGWSWLAWLAPLPWLAWIVRPSLASVWRPSTALWFSSLLFWLVLLEGIRRPHWIMVFGWLALGLYVSVYLVGFVALGRVAVQRLRIPLPVAAPILWVGLEYLRSHFATGFSVALLGHSQYQSPQIIQVADLTGGYGLSGLMVFVAACLTCATTGLRAASFPSPGDPSPGDHSGGDHSGGVSPRGNSPRSLLARLGWLALAAASLAGCLAYGQYRLGQVGAAAELASGDSAPLKLAVLQGSRNVFYEYDPQVNEAIFQEYLQTSRAACRAHPDLELLVWPESSFTRDFGELVLEPDWELPAQFDGDRSQYRARIEAFRNAFLNRAAQVQQELREASGTSSSPHLIVGTDAVHIGRKGRQSHRNSTLHFDRAGRIQERYYKMHPVMFGEYIPFFDWFPWLYDYTPMPVGLTPGEAPAAFAVQGRTLGPNVCFETTVPHLIRRHVRTLTRQGTPPDALVNVSNDGWFHGSAVLDIHFACGVFRAVEMRREVLVAANTGPTAVVAPTGEVRQKLPYMVAGYLVTELHARPQVESPYLWLGDWLPWSCFLGCVAVAGFACLRRSRSRGADPHAAPAKQ